MNNHTNMNRIEEYNRWRDRQPQGSVLSYEEWLQMSREPEKKDVWEDRFRDELWQEDWTYETGMKYINFIKTHFISRADVVEIIKKMPLITRTEYYEGHAIDRVDLLDLLTQEK